VPDDHLVREIAAVLDLSWVHAELAPYYAKIGSISRLAVRQSRRRTHSLVAQPLLKWSLLPDLLPSPASV
jgi:hypothetical protein